MTIKIRATCDNAECYNKGDEFEVKFHEGFSFIMCRSVYGPMHMLLDKEYHEITLENIKEAKNFEVIENE